MLLPELVEAAKPKKKMVQQASKHHRCYGSYQDNS
jgi:hypothetical protein